MTLLALAAALPSCRAWSRVEPTTSDVVGHAGVGIRNGLAHLFAGDVAGASLFGDRPMLRDFASAVRRAPETFRLDRELLPRMPDVRLLLRPAKGVGGPALGQH